MFSPPHTAVQVLGERVANGFTLEIHDRGLGMAPDALLDANLRLAETPEFELSDTDRLGLFVVSRLAQRQNVRVSLQPSPYGGTTAVVFIPGALLTETSETDGTEFRLDRRVASSGRPAARGRTAIPAARPPVADSRRHAASGPAARRPGRTRGAARPSWRTEHRRRGRRSAPERRERQRPGPRAAAGTPRRRRPCAATRDGRRPRGPPARRTEQHQQAGDEPDSSRPRPRAVRRAASPRCRAAAADARARRRPRPHRRRRRPTRRPRRRAVAGSGRGRRPRTRRRTAAHADCAAGDPASAHPRRPPAAAQSGTVGGLPRRVRQASLAPQLRQDTAPSGRRQRGDARPSRTD